MTLVVAACSGSGRPVSVPEYRDRLVVISDQFQAVSGTDSSDEELLQAAILFAAYEDAYDTIAGLEPPSELQELHREFVEAFSVTQRRAAEYIGQEGMEGTFSFASLRADPDFQSVFEAMQRSCDDLRLEIARVLDEPIPDTCCY